jgi:predicted membrane protein
MKHMRQTKGKNMVAINSKKVAFITMMIVLGNVLSGISTYLGPLAPGVNLDLSHITTFIAAIYGGPIYGLIVGFFGGAWSGFYFGFVGGSLAWLSLIGVPIGKSLTGLTTGLFYRVFKIRERKHASVITVPAVLSSYVPETLFTVFYFVALAPIVVPSISATFMLGFILPKAWVEITFMSFLMAALVGNNGFSTFISNFLATTRAKMRP